MSATPQKGEARRGKRQGHGRAGASAPETGGGIPENIKQEANQLRERAKNAPPAEKAQIEQRAGELLRQLQNQGIR